MQFELSNSGVFLINQNFKRKHMKIQTFNQSVLTNQRVPLLKKHQMRYCVKRHAALTHTHRSNKNTSFFDRTEGSQDHRITQIYFVLSQVYGVKYHKVS